MQTKKSFQYWQWRVIICSMVGYSMFYFVRKNFSFAMPSLAEEYGITNTSFGIILTLVGLIYGVSKFLNGFIADRTNARWHMTIGLVVCVIVNVLFGYSDLITTWFTGITDSKSAVFVASMVNVMAVLLILNNIFQGTGFSPCNRLMTHWVPPKELATKMSIWNVSHSVGASFVSVLCGYIIAETGNWRLCFWIPAAISAFGVFFIVTTLRDTPKSVGLPELEGIKSELSDDADNEAYKAFVKKMVFRNPTIWLLALCDLCVYIVRFAVLDWGPTFLTQGENPLSSMWAGWTVAIFEFCGCAGMLAAGWISDRFFGGKAHRFCLIEMGLVSVCLLVLWLLPSDGNPLVMLFVLALSGFLLYGPQALLGVVASNQVTNKAASAAVGLIGLFSYMSVIFTGVGLGWFSDNFGWDHLFLLMSFVGIIGMLLLVPVWNKNTDGYIHVNEEK